MLKNLFLILSIVLFYLPIYAQGSFDSVKRDRATPSSTSPKKKVSTSLNRRAVLTSDSTIVISARVLMNLEADGYMVTIALREFASSINQCNQQLDKKINKLVEEIESLNIKREQIFIDMISQYPVYGYDIERKNATEQLEGFEINKNLIIRAEALDQIKLIINKAAEQNIYDVVKVDYLVEDIESIYESLFLEAGGIIKRKRELYDSVSAIGEITRSYIKLEQFQIIYPNQQYSSYQAFDASDIEYRGFRSRGILENERKKTTVYFEGISYSGFDKFINPQKVEVGLQAIFELQIQYEFK